MFGEAQSPIMKNNKFIKNVLHSFVILPLMGTTLAMNPMLSIGANMGGLSLSTTKQVEISPEEQVRLDHAAKIDAYFKDNEMPLTGHGYKFVEVAEANGLDWRLLAAIATRESTGGREMCKNPKAPNNPFGWNSCKSGFKTIDAAIETVGAHLGGNMASTARHYADKDTLHILNAYNPPSIVKNYTKQVLAIMSSIEKHAVPATTVATTDTTQAES